jgi:dihydroxycyclohexadiene carboxylate dehydrogenase
VLPVMLEQGGGVIVNISSVATRGVNRVPYAAAKGGVNAITACLAFEYMEHRIRVCGVAPGATEAPPRRIPRNAAPPIEQEKVWYRQIVDQAVSSSLMKRFGTTWRHSCFWPRTRPPSSPALRCPSQAAT